MADQDLKNAQGAVLRTAATEYAGRGWHVFPTYGIVNGRCECGTACGSPGKHPRTPHGLKDATDNQEIIEEWWKRWPNANIGVVTGKVSGIYVLDLDNKRSVTLPNGEMVPEGVHSIREQELAIGPLPDTLTSLTGSGGTHLVFRYPTTDMLGQQERTGPGQSRESVSLGNRAGILASVDIRGDGGYIVAPPSLHQSGNRYRWVEKGQPITNLTSAWISLLTTQDSAERHSLDLEIAPEFRILEGEGRHDWLFKMGSKLRGQNGLPYAALYGALSAYNAQVLVPPLESVEVEHIVQSCMKFEPEIINGSVNTNIASVSVLEEGDDVAIPFSDFMAANLPASVPLIEKLLHSGEVMIVGGQPNIGKTWVVMDMMMGIASGTTFARTFPCSQASVLFIDEEGSEGANQDRFRMLLQGRDQSGVEFPIFSKIGAGLKVDTPKGRTTLSRLIERYRPGVVVLDSLVRMHGRDESNNRQMADFFAVIRQLKETYGCAFIFTHHIRKPSGEGKEDPTWILRGAGDIQGYPDSILVFQSGEDTSVINAIHTKMRNGERLKDFQLGLRIHDDEKLAVVSYLGEIDHQAVGNRNGILNIIRRMGSATEHELAGETGLSITTVLSHCKALEGRQLVHEYFEPGGKRWWVNGPSRS